MMRLVIDMQGAQAPGSRNRGIGRYSISLLKSLIRNKKNDEEIILLLNGAFLDSAEDLRRDFSEHLPLSNIVTWYPPLGCCFADEQNNNRRNSAELIREAVIKSLSPDVLLISSLVEGLLDDSVTSIGKYSCQFPVAVVFYDLIPFINKDLYFKNPVFEKWFLNKYDSLCRADLLLAISESSRNEVVNYLSYPGDNAVNISTACDDVFIPVAIGDSERSYIKLKYSITGRYIMYTGGIDLRKNIDGLIRSFSEVTNRIRNNVQLVIVCSAKQDEIENLKKLASSNGLNDNEVVFTGFVPDEDLLLLYNAAEFFVFPSLHEGFGLPALEAMSCGKAVIGSNTSSIPEVIGNGDALFNPRNLSEITSKIELLLSNPGLVKDFEQKSIAQSKKFSWDQTGQMAWNALRKVRPVYLRSRDQSRRPKMAYVSPLPKAKSGIADYSRELIQVLSRYYDLELILCQEEPLDDAFLSSSFCIRDVSYFAQNSTEYDRVLYHFGNSHFHAHMFDLLERIPGVVVLHDFFLSGALFHMEINSLEPWIWSKFLLDSHGWKAVQSRHLDGQPLEKIVFDYPANFPVLKNALGVIVHSESSIRMAKAWYGPNIAEDWDVIPLLRVPAYGFSRDDCRSQLGLSDDEFVVTSFGFIGKPKLNLRLLDAWLASSLSKNKSCRLVFVGQNDPGEYGQQLLKRIHENKAKVHITGWVDSESYFKWLAASDMSVQLRSLSRGETSASVLDCMNFGIPLIVNENGSMADLPDEGVFKIQDTFVDHDLVSALEKLWGDDLARHDLGMRAREIVLKKHSPLYCANRYRSSIEKYYGDEYRNDVGLIRQLNSIKNWSDEDCVRVSDSLSKNFPPSLRKRQILIDVTDIQNEFGAIDVAYHDFLRKLLLVDSFDSCVELVSFDKCGSYRYSKRLVCQLLSFWDGWCEDELIDSYPGDILINIGNVFAYSPLRVNYLRGLKLAGVRYFSYITDGFSIGDWNNLSTVLRYFDGYIVQSVDLFDDVEFALKCFAPVSENFNYCILTSPDLTKDVTCFLKNLVASVAANDFSEKHNFISKFFISDGGWHFFGTDPRLASQVGVFDGLVIKTNARSGLLVYGPYIPMSAGFYQVKIQGKIGRLGASRAKIDVSINKGEDILGEYFFDEQCLGDYVAILPIELKESCSDLEIRFWVDEGSDLEMSMIDISYSVRSLN